MNNDDEKENNKDTAEWIEDHGVFGMCSKCKISYRKDILNIIKPSYCPECGRFMTNVIKRKINYKR